MLPWIQSHAGLLTLLGVMAVTGIVAPLVRAKTLALRAYRARQSADERGAKAIAIGATLDAVTALAATLVLSVEGEVRNLKDPTKPQLGVWNPAVDGPRFLHRVVTDLTALGGDTVRQLRELKGLDVESTTKLLEHIAEAQVQKLRATPAPVLSIPSKPLSVTLRGDELALGRSTVAPPAPIEPALTLTVDVTEVSAAVRAATSAEPANQAR